MQAWPESKTLGDILRSMHDRNADTIFLLGDSITSLFMHEMKNLVKRESFEIFSFEYDHFPGFWSAEIQVPKRLVTDGASPPSWKIHFIDIASVNSADSFEADEYKKSIDAQLTNVNGKALFIVNAGLHFQLHFSVDDSPELIAERLAVGKDNYSRLLRELFFPMFVAYAKDGHTVIFRETSATHFPTPTGLQDIRY